MLNFKKVTTTENEVHGLKKFTKRELVVVWGIILFLIFFDFVTRFNDGTAQVSNEWSQEQLSSTGLLALNEVEFKQISEKLKRYESTAKTKVEKQQGLSEAEMLAQKGDLKELYAKNMRLMLVGTFEQDGRFAVVAQENLTTNKRELRRVTLTDTLNGYAVTNILPNKLILTGYSNVINLHLYNTSS